MKNAAIAKVFQDIASLIIEEESCGNTEGGKIHNR